MIGKHLGIISSLLLSQSLYAGTMGAVAEVLPSWEFSALALYAKPSFGGNGLGYSTFGNYGYDNFGNLVEVNGARNQIHTVNPDWGWGFQLEGAYHYRPSLDVDLNWYHLHTQNQAYLPSGTLYAGSAANLYAGLLRIEPRWDAVNLELGQQLDLIPDIMTRLHVGVEFARIKNTFTNHPRLLPTANPVFITEDATRFNGFGPRLGFDLARPFLNGFGIYAKAAGMLLVGTGKQSVRGYYNLPSFTSNPFPNPYSTGNYVQSNTLVIPGFEGKLGLTYDLHIGQNHFGLNVGYLWVDYLNVLVSQVGAGVVSSAISTSVAANYNVNGLYFGARWSPNI